MGDSYILSDTCAWLHNASITRNAEGFIAKVPSSGGSLRSKGTPTTRDQASLAADLVLVRGGSIANDESEPPGAFASKRQLAKIDIASLLVH